MTAFEKKQYGLITAVDLKRGHGRRVYWTFWVIALLLAVICILPCVWVLLSAFKTTQEFMAVPPVMFPSKFDLHKVARVWKEARIGTSYFSTLGMVLGDVCFSVVINGLAGYVLSRLKPRGYGLVLALVLWAMLMPTSVSMVPLFMSFIEVPVFHVNLSESFLPMWLMAGANAFYVLMFKEYFDSISISLVESAKIDGGSDIHIFFRIILPLSTPILATVAIFTLTGSWGGFFWPYLLIKNTDLMPIGVKIFSLQSSMSADEYLMVLLFVIIPPILFFLFLQKYIMGGINEGGVKG